MAARNFRVGQHVVRVVYRSHGHYGMYEPNVLVFLQGPNGSPAGFGPKGWPRILRPLFPKYGQYRPDRWSNTLWIPVPHLRWRTAYRLRRLGGLRLYRALYRALT